MKKEYEDVYEELTKTYKDLPPSRWLRSRLWRNHGLHPHSAISMIERSIHSALRDLDITGQIRPDAIHFLLVNMHQMVSLPIIAANSLKANQLDQIQNEADAKNYPISQLGDDIKSDIYEILKYAKDNSSGIISGRAILQSTSAIYGRLKTSASNVWG